MPDLEFVLAQFGPRNSSLEPSLTSVRTHFPDARVVLYSDSLAAKGSVDELRLVKPPYSRSHPRYGHRSNDLFKVTGLLESEADVAVALDGDMLIVTLRPSSRLRCDSGSPSH